MLPAEMPSVLRGNTPGPAAQPKPTESSDSCSYWRSPDLLQNLLFLILSFPKAIFFCLQVLFVQVLWQRPAGARFRAGNWQRFQAVRDCVATGTCDATDTSWRRKCDVTDTCRREKVRRDRHVMPSHGAGVIHRLQIAVSGDSHQSVTTAERWTGPADSREASPRLFPC